MFAKTLSKNTAAALALLGESGILKNAYLAGGTALALLLGHRLSEDLYFLAKEFSLEQMLKFYDQKYGVLENHLYIILRSMDYFAEAEIDELPEMLIPVSWEEVKKFFHDQSLKLARETLKI